MNSDMLGALFMIGMAGYMVFSYWKKLLKIVIGIIVFCVVYTYYSLKKYFYEPNGKDKIEEVVNITVQDSKPTYINE